MRTVEEHESAPERAALVSVVARASHQPDPELLLDELAGLTRAAGASVVLTMVQERQRPDPSTLIGRGKADQLAAACAEAGADLVIVDNALSPAQARNLEEIVGRRVIDRTALILDIFAKRARTREGQLQVELAQLQYLLPRLAGSATALSRLGAGIGTRGPGETKLETDRRRLRDRISRLEKQLEALARGRMQRRQKRIRAGVPIVSIVGYTNAGKSTLLNALTQSEVFTEDLLFATLDTSTRRLRFPLEREVIITDTVGFIRHLPKSLIGAFKATLEELEDADLLLHVVDLSHPRFEEHIRAVERILQDLELDRIPRLRVFNKVDLVPEEEIAPLCRRFDAIPVSARNRRTFEFLLAELERRFWPEEAGNP